MMLDTSFLVDVVRGDAAARGILAEWLDRGEPLRIPAPVVFEFWEAVERSRAPTRETDVVDAVLAHHEIVPVGYAAARRAGRLAGYLARRGESYAALDVLVAAVALEADDAIATRRREAFSRVPDLRVVSY